MELLVHNLLSKFVSGAPTAPAAASATSGSGHVSCLKRRLRMIMRAKTPKGLSWAGRFTVLGMAAVLLPLAPSWAQQGETEKPAKERRESLRKYTEPTRERAMLNDSLGRSKYDEPRDRLTQDDDQDDDDKEHKAREAAERFQEQLKDLIGKLGKELSPVTEEVRKALERAVGEVHKSLEKEDRSAEDLGKALEKSQDELRKAFEGGGPVDKELREAIEHARKDLQEAFDHARRDAQDQVETLRQRSMS